LFVGEPLRDFQGVLTGVPSYTGSTGPLLHDDSNAKKRDGLEQRSSETRNRPEDSVAEHGRNRDSNQQRN
jgi:hypothetical protein